MKYIIFYNRSQFLPLIFPDHVTHCMVKLEGCTPVSAGHFNINNGIIEISPNESESMKLGPHLRDKELITSSINNSGMYAFLDDTIYAEASLKFHETLKKLND